MFSLSCDKPCRVEFNFLMITFLLVSLAELIYIMNHFDMMPLTYVCSFYEHCIFLISIVKIFSDLWMYTCNIDLITLKCIKRGK